MGSEALLLYYNSKGLDTLLLLGFATVGNTLGSVVNYFLGKYATVWAMKKNYIKALHVKRSKDYFNRYGAFVILLAWVPIIGDPITFVAGVLKYNFWRFLILVFISKFSRYAFLIYSFSN